VRIDDERDLHGQLEAAFEAITPRPAPVDGAVRRGRAIKVRRRVAVAAGAAAAVAIGVFAVPSLLHQTASPAPVSPAKVKPYTVTVQAPGPHSAPGLIASGTIDGKRWQFTAAKPGTGTPEPGGQIFTTSGPAFGGASAFALPSALAVNSAHPVSFDIGGLVLTRGPVQVQYGAVRADVTYVAVRLGNGTVLILHPVAVYRVLAARRDRRRVPLQRPERGGRLRRLAHARAVRAGPGFGPDRLGHGQRARVVGHRLPGPVGHLLPGPRDRAHGGILRAHHF